MLFIKYLYLERMMDVDSVNCFEFRAHSGIYLSQTNIYNVLLESYLEGVRLIELRCMKRCMN